MRLDFWGVSGTTPVSGRNRTQYGGHTPCASVKAAGGELIIIDAGTGLRKLGRMLKSERGEEPLQVSLLLTHFHLDHITGFPFFAPLYSPGAELNIYSGLESGEAEKLLSGLMSGKYFPIDYFETPARKIFRKIPYEEGFEIGKVRIAACPLRHPQGSLAFRLQQDDEAFVFATDTEHPEKGLDEKLARFAQGADILVYDAMFTPEEYQQGKQGWGHSTWQEGVKIARAAGIARLILSHFNPDHSDEVINYFISKAGERYPRTEGARERAWPPEEA